MKFLLGDCVASVEANEADDVISVGYFGPGVNVCGSSRGYMYVVVNVSCKQRETLRYEPQAVRCGAVQCHS